MPPKKRGPRVTAQQLEYLVNFVCEKENTSILTMKTTPCKETELKKMWEKASVELNRMNGPFKQSEDWRRFFVELKSKIRAKARAFKVAQQKTGGGTNDTKPLTEIEEKLMSHIGWVSITGCNDLPDEIDPSTNNSDVLPNYDIIEIGNVVEMDEVEIYPVNLEELESTEIMQVEQVQRNEVQAPSGRRQDIKASEFVQREPVNTGQVASPTRKRRASEIMQGERVRTDEVQTPGTKRNKGRRQYSPRVNLLHTSADTYADATKTLTIALTNFTGAINTLAVSINALAESIKNHNCTHCNQDCNDR